MKLSEHFTLEELIASDTAKAKGIDNTPTEAVIANLSVLVVNVLEPLRVAMNRPIVVTSAYRSPKLNTAVGGSSTSHHLTGCAADIRFNRSEKEYTDADIFDYLYRHLPYTELIAEGIPSGWVHVAYDPSRSDKAVKYMVSSAGTVHKSTYDKIMALYRQYGMAPKR